MADNLEPRDAAEVEQAIQWAIAGGKTLEVVGRGSKRRIGRAAQWDMTLDLSRLSGVTLYEPAELVLSAKAGTPLAEIEKLLAANNQELAFEPMERIPAPVFVRLPVPDRPLPWIAWVCPLTTLMVAPAGPMVMGWSGAVVPPTMLPMASRKPVAPVC